MSVYLYGSAVSGTLQQNSDLDLLAVVRRPTTADQRVQLGRRLRPLSRRGERPADWRPIELTLVAQADIKPLRHPLRTDFQYGEWLRDDFDAGRVDPANPENPDLLVLLAQAAADSRPLRGPDARTVIAGVPPSAVRSAMLASVDGLLADLATDTTNVVLTLARIWVTLATGRFVPKDEAAKWSADRIDERARSALLHAGAVYRGDDDEDWMKHDAKAAATQLAQAISRA